MAWISSQAITTSVGEYYTNENNEEVAITQEYELYLEIKGLTIDKLNTIMKSIYDNL